MATLQQAMAWQAVAWQAMAWQAVRPNHGGTTVPRFQFVLTDSRDPISQGQGDRRGERRKQTKAA